MGLRERVASMKGAGYRRVQEWREKRSEGIAEERRIGQLHKETYKKERLKAREEEAVSFGRFRAKEEAGLRSYRYRADIKARKAAIRKQAKTRYKQGQQNPFAWSMKGGDSNLNQVILPPAWSAKPKQVRTKKGKKREYEAQNQYDVNAMILPPMQKKRKFDKMEDMWW